jgi:release factor glutamine methyltransferase
MSRLKQELRALQEHISPVASGAARLAASPELRDTAARDALTLLLHTLGITRAQFYANPDRALAPVDRDAYDAAIARRLTNEPIQYITGEQEFYGLALHVTPAVLIPRPETEHLVEAVLSCHPAAPVCHPAAPVCHPAAQRRDLLLPSSAPPQEPLRILDIGTGSGAIALALAAHLPHAHIIATDISPAALDLARANAARHNLTARIRFLESDLLAALDPTEPFDAIVSNPPYVPTADRATLHPQVRDHEPCTALFAGLDGLDIYRRLIPQAHAALAPNGLLALEIGHNQRDAIAALLTGWRDLRFLNDLQQIPRVALARKP